MKHTIATMMIAATSALGAQAQTADSFKYTDEKFADIQMLRYKVEGFDKLTLKEKTFIYYLQEAALDGRDILFDQNGRYNLRIRALLEAVYTNYKGNHKDAFYQHSQYTSRGCGSRRAYTTTMVVRSSSPNLPTRLCAPPSTRCRPTSCR